MTSAHCNLHLPGSSDAPASVSQVARIIGAHHYTWPIFIFFVKMRVHHVGQAVLKLLTSGNQPTSDSQSAGKLRWENLLSLGGGGFSEQRLCHCTPASTTEQDSVFKKKKFFY